MAMFNRIYQQVKEIGAAVEVGCHHEYRTQYIIQSKLMLNRYCLRAGPAQDISST
jgi:hypothetical protein